LPASCAATSGCRSGSSTRPGGTPIAAWLSPAAHRALDPGIDQELARLRAGLAELPELEAAYAAAVQVWERGAFPPDPPNSAAERGWARPDLDDGGWATMRLPGFWQDHGMRFNGVVWFRRAVEIPAAWAGRELTLSLGAIDDFDHTYFDGVLVGAHPSGHPSASQIPREYRIPGRLVRAGRSVIAVRVFDHYGQGGFAGPSRALWLGPVGEPGEAVSLTGDWRLFAEHPIPLVPSSVWATCPTPPLLLRPHHVPGALHHGMNRAAAPVRSSRHPLVPGRVGRGAPRALPRAADRAHPRFARRVRAGAAPVPAGRARRPPRGTHLAVPPRGAAAGPDRARHRARHRA
jgi:hypothetical protein